MNGGGNDKFYPIEKMFENFIKAEYISKDKFINYQNAINVIPKEELIKSKQYLGHKLFWYINLCIEGNKFPKNEEKIKEDTIQIPVQVNGKVRATVEIGVDEEQASVLEKAHAMKNVQSFLDGKTIVKEIYVKGRIVNIVVK